MSNPRCSCTRCRLDGITGPVVLITLGAIFLTGQVGWRYSAWDLWPILLIALGLVKIAQALASTEGHVGA
jgi:hypothetical protein